MALKTIAVFGPDDKYLSHCTWKRALKLLESGRAIRINSATIRLKQTKREKIRKKHDIIAESKRICYICNKKIPEDIDYDEVYSLRKEAVQKLKDLRPASVGQASRISGVSPADISVLLIYLGR